jgi:sugar phosphate isomerase/epimerase
MGNLSVALQAYTVRDFAEKDLKGTLTQVKQMGYDTIELAGMYGMTPADFKALLDEVGLSAISAHVALPEFEADAAATVARYKQVGVQYMAVPWLPPELCPDGADFDKTLAALNKIGKICKDHGITLMYHNHDFEFRKLPNGEYGLDHLFKQIPADILQAQIDTCWVKFAGLDPADYVRQYAGRCPVVHLKDFIVEGEGGTPYELIGADKKAEQPKGKFEFRPLGRGCQDFPAIIKAASESGASWLVVELDEAHGCTSMEAAKISREYLKSLGY